MKMGGRGGGGGGAEVKMCVVAFMADRVYVKEIYTAMKYMKYMII